MVVIQQLFWIQVYRNANCISRKIESQIFVIQNLCVLGIRIGYILREPKAFKRYIHMSYNYYLFYLVFCVIQLTISID